MGRFLNMLLSSKAGYESLILRIPIGLILVAHGSQKLFGWFDGFGLVATGQFMARIGLEPGYLMALLAGSAEFFVGISLILGFFTRLAAFVTALTLFVALVTVHWDRGFFLDNHGIEYVLALQSATCALFVMGGGKLSIDRYLENKFLMEW